MAKALIAVEMSESCGECELVTGFNSDGYGRCPLTGDIITDTMTGRCDGCPGAPLPEGGLELVIRLAQNHIHAMEHRLNDSKKNSVSAEVLARPTKDRDLAVTTHEALKGLIDND